MVGDDCRMADTMEQSAIRAAAALMMEFIRNLKAARILSEASRQVLVEMTIAVRFGWLSEWLRSRDAEMIELETVYMRLLMDHAEDLINLWHL